jgi:hypothetical protein
VKLTIEQRLELLELKVDELRYCDEWERVFSRLRLIEQEFYEKLELAEIRAKYGSTA